MCNFVVSLMRINLGITAETRAARVYQKGYWPFCVVISVFSSERSVLS